MVINFSDDKMQVTQVICRKNLMSVLITLGIFDILKWALIGVAVVVVAACVITIVVCMNRNRNRKFCLTFDSELCGLYVISFFQVVNVQ